jgi:hypothetical protein
MLSGLRVAFRSCSRIARVAPHAIGDARSCLLPCSMDRLAREHCNGPAGRRGSEGKLVVWHDAGYAT